MTDKQHSKEEIDLEKIKGESSIDIKLPYHNQHNPKWKTYRLNEKYKEQYKKDFNLPGFPTKVRVCVNCWVKE